MLMLTLNITIVQLAIEYSVCWHGHVLRMEDGCVLRMALESDIEG